jgi:hypothetical protein
MQDIDLGEMICRRRKIQPYCVYEYCTALEVTYIMVLCILASICCIFNWKWSSLRIVWIRPGIGLGTGNETSYKIFYNSVRAVSYNWIVYTSIPIRHHMRECGPQYCKASTSPPAVDLF